MTTTQLIAQGIGLVASATGILSHQFKNNKVFFTMQTVASGLFAVHFAMIGGYTGMAQNVLSVLRCLLLSFPQSKFASHKFWPWLLSAMFAATAALTYDGLISLLPPVAMIASTFFMWARKPDPMRYCQLFCSSPCWLIYNIRASSLAGILTEVFSMCSCIVYFIRYRLKRKSDAADR